MGFNPGHRLSPSEQELKQGRRRDPAELRTGPGRGAWVYLGKWETIRSQVSLPLLQGRLGVGGRGEASPGHPSLSGAESPCHRALPCSQAASSTKCVPTKCPDVTPLNFLALPRPRGLPLAQGMSCPGAPCPPPASGPLWMWAPRAPSARAEPALPPPGNGLVAPRTPPRPAAPEERADEGQDQARVWAP